MAWRRQARSAANRNPRRAQDSGRRHTTDQPRPYPASVSLSFTPGTHHLLKRNPWPAPCAVSRRDSSSLLRDAGRVPAILSPCSIRRVTSTSPSTPAGVGCPPPRAPLGPPTQTPLPPPRHGRDGAPHF